MASPQDIFYVVGYTRNDILGGRLFALTEIGVRGLAKNGELHRRYGPLIPAATAGSVTRELAEVYFLSPFMMGDEQAERYSEFQTVAYLNDIALGLCKEFGTSLPTVLTKISREEMQQQGQIGTILKFEAYFDVRHGLN